MGTYVAIDTFDSILASSRHTPIILNDLRADTQAERAAIAKHTRTEQRGDYYSNMASCECGVLVGAKNLGRQCGVCYTDVSRRSDEALEMRVWIRSPVNHPQYGLIRLVNPLIWNMLRKEFTQHGFNYIDWICKTDPMLSKAQKPEVNLDVLRSKGVIRGYSNFIINFRQYLDYLYELKIFEDKRHSTGLMELLDKLDPTQIFTTHIPVLHRSQLLLEDQPVGRYMDHLLGGVIDVIAMMQGIDTRTELTFSTRENRAAKMLNILSEYYELSFHNVLAQKPGWMRKNLYGSRSPFGARGVISSNSQPHEYDTIQISWGQGITMLELHLKNKLLKRGWTPNRIHTHLNRHVHKYCPMLDGLFKELIAETLNSEGFWGIFVRNPSLTRTSTQAMRITAVKTDPTDPTITMSLMAVVGFNAKVIGSVGSDTDRITALIAGTPLESRYHCEQQCKATV